MNLLNSLLDKFKYLFYYIIRINKKFYINDIEIILPGTHQLPVYKKRNEKYDLFIEYLSKYITKNTSVIDIGANVGDTLCSIITNNKNVNIYSIEGDPFFFSYLQNNLKRINSKIKFTKSIKIFKCFIGNKRSGRIERSSKGTSIFKDGGEIKSISLDSFVQSQKIKKISLIKIDTDGYDYDIIQSGKRSIRQNKPVIFFECQINNKSNDIKYQNTLKYLDRIGYKYFTVFDNYGQVLLNQATIKLIKELNNYVFYQKTKTIYYLDILCFQNNNKKFVNKSINHYLKLV